MTNPKPERGTQSGSPTAPTSGMWGKKGRGYPELARTGGQEQST